MTASESLQEAIAFTRDRLLVAQVKLQGDDLAAAADEVRSAAETLEAAVENLRDEIGAAA